MGDVQSVPIVGEAVTAVEVATKLAFASVCKAVGKKDASESLLKGAGRSFIDYTEKNVIAAPINAAMRMVNGDKAEARRIVNTSKGAFLNVADSTPVVGHIKGAFHYLEGDTEQCNKCMLNASRSAAVMGAGLVTGGAGFGAIAGGVAGVGTGLGYDFVSSVFNQEEMGHVKRLMHASDDANDMVDTVLGLAGDFASGYASAKVGTANVEQFKEPSLNTSNKSLKSPNQSDSGCGNRTSVFGENNNVTFGIPIPVTLNTNINFSLWSVQDH